MIISEIRSTILRLPTVYINGDGLQDILIIEVGAEKAKGIGELPAKAPAARMIQFGGQ